MSARNLVTDWPSRHPPEYRKPPVVETALAVEFAPIKGWNIVQFGALWERFKKLYPKVEVYPAPQELLSQVVPNPGMPPRFDVANPPVRCFFISPENSQLVQIRAGAFVRNWRASQENQKYPRYKTIRPSFENDLRVFLAFLQESGFDAPEIWKCEVTYVNHFVRGREWQTPSEIYRILPTLAPPVSSEVLANIHQLTLAQIYNLPEEIGQIQFQLQPGRRSDGTEILQLAITAFGSPRGSHIDQVLNWIDLGHFAVVQGFTDFTSPEVQGTVWERIWP